MKAGVVAFLLSLALINISLADFSDSLEEDIEKQDDPQTPPDGIIFADGELSNDALFTKRNDILLEEVANRMKNSTVENGRDFKQCNKFGDHVICISLSLFDLQEFYNQIAVADNGEHLDNEENSEDNQGNDGYFNGDDVDNAEEKAEE